MRRLPQRDDGYVAFMRLLLCLAIVVATVVSVAPAVAASQRSCGLTASSKYAFKVSAHGPVKCRNAKTLVRSFFSRKGFKKHGGPYVANTYYTSRRWPGWKCGLAAGGGGCTKRDPFRRVTYQAFKR